MNMKESEQNSISDPYANDEIDMRELFNVIWEGKKLIILITSIVAISAVVFSLMLTNFYRSESVLVARQAQDSSALSQFSGLASLAGVGLPSAAGDSVTEVMEMIKSREFVKHLMTFEDVLPSMMAAKNFDSASQELYFDPKIYNAKTKTWTREPSNNKGSKPSYIETHKVYLSDILSISQDKRTGLISIMVEHISPIFAKDLLALIIKEANTLRREKDITTSSKALSFLKVELSRTPLTEIKESINQLIKNQLETGMMAKIHEEYSLVIIEPPFIPERKSKPNRAMICVIATMFGGILSLIIVLVRHYLLGKETINKHTIV
jgi:capsular polysaccharide biosynthesis protein